MANDTPEEFLAEANIAVLATIDRRGKPHAAPIWYLYEDGEIIMSTGRNSIKHRNIGSYPDVTFVVDRREIPYYAVMVHGMARIIPKPLDAERRLRMATRYLGEDLAKRYIESRPDEDSVTIRLRPERISEYKSPSRV
ncbi:MAG: TIGR03618 family F420-dependent PPOX class oxidoreductase [Dehalococcoidia bacterium]